MSCIQLVKTMSTTDRTETISTVDKNRKAIEILQHLSVAVVYNC